MLHYILQITSLDVLATVLEEMPPFPEKESSGLLNLLKKKKLLLKQPQELTLQVLLLN